MSEDREWGRERNREKWKINERVKNERKEGKRKGGGCFHLLKWHVNYEWRLKEEIGFVLT